MPGLEPAGGRDREGEEAVVGPVAGGEGEDDEKDEVVYAMKMEGLMRLLHRLQGYTVCALATNALIGSAKTDSVVRDGSVAVNRNLCNEVKDRVKDYYCRVEAEVRIECRKKSKSRVRCGAKHESTLHVKARLPVLSVYPSQNLIHGDRF